MGNPLDRRKKHAFINAHPGTEAVLLYGKVEFGPSHI